MIDCLISVPRIQLSYFTLYFQVGGGIIPTFQMKKLRLNGPSWDLNMVFLVPEFTFLVTMLV